MNHDAPPNAEAAWLVERLWERGLLRSGDQPGTGVEQRKQFELANFLAHASQVTRCDERNASVRRLLGLLDRMSSDVPNCGLFTFGLPGVAQDRSFAWLGHRLIWWPRGIPGNPRLAIVSSRLGRPIETRRSWFAALRVVCQDAQRRNELLVSVDKTAAERFVRRSASLFDLPLLTFHLARSDQSASAWLLRCDQQRRGEIPTTPDRFAQSIWRAWLSPPLTPDRGGVGPLQDRVLFAAADRVFACRVRSGGNIEQMLERRIDERSEAVLQCVLAVATDLVPPAVSERLKKRGADLLPIHVPDRPMPVHAAALPDAGPDSPGRIVTLEQMPHVDAYLVHSTRHQSGPWPEQEVDDYLDDLILDRPASDHSVLAALVRIVVRQRLVATGRAIRGGARVVSFSAIPLSELQDFRIYRPHRGRWDFEPYGLGIARTWLEEHGAQPVVYGDSKLWNELPANARPFFQLRQSGRDGTIDWSIEREWRHIGDVPLEQLPGDAAFIFVRTRADAESLVPVCRWPIVVVERW